MLVCSPACRLTRIAVQRLQLHRFLGERASHRKMPRVPAAVRLVRQTSCARYLDITDPARADARRLEVVAHGLRVVRRCSACDRHDPLWCAPWRRNCKTKRSKGSKGRARNRSSRRRGLAQRQPSSKAAHGCLAEESSIVRLPRVSLCLSSGPLVNQTRNHLHDTSCYEIYKRKNMPRSALPLLTQQG